MEKVRSLVAGFVVFTISVPALADPGDSCTIDISGGLTASEKITEPPKKPGADDDIMKGPHVTGGTGYWMTTGQMAAANAEVSRATGGNKKGAAAQDGFSMDDPLMLFTLDCHNDNVSVTFMPAQKSKAANIPFKPSHYRIAAKDSAKPGDFLFTVNVTDKGEAKIFNSSEGQLELTQFDAHGAKGKYTFTGKEWYGNRTVSVTGTFSVKCKGAACKP